MLRRHPFDPYAVYSRFPIVLSERYTMLVCLLMHQIGSTMVGRSNGKDPEIRNDMMENGDLTKESEENVKGINKEKFMQENSQDNVNKDHRKSHAAQNKSQYTRMPNSRGRADFARVLVEFDVKKGFEEEICIQYMSKENIVKGTKVCRKVNKSNNKEANDNPVMNENNGSNKDDKGFIEVRYRKNENWKSNKNTVYNQKKGNQGILRTKEGILMECTREKR
ncbi:hypothetical protein Tco_1205376 [Tanacetum coccineum]